MSWYTRLHAAAEGWLEDWLRSKGHETVRQKRMDTEVIFDVFDKTENTAWEVLTAKIVRSAHEQDEAIIAKIFRYLLWAPALKFLIVSYNREEFEFMHNMAIEHWHLSTSEWGSPKFGKPVYHSGKPAKEIALGLIKTMLSLAPLKEWTEKGRRARHPKVPKKFEEVAHRLGLPKNFLKGLYRDWKLMWVWKLEAVIPKFVKRYAREL